MYGSAKWNKRQAALDGVYNLGQGISWSTPGGRVAHEIVGAAMSRINAALLAPYRGILRGVDWAPARAERDHRDGYVAGGA
jgi:hypothetical protein